MKNGTSRQVLRKYKKGYSGFSTRLFCGCCGGMLEADTWNMGSAGKKQNIRYGYAETVLLQGSLTVHSEKPHRNFFMKNSVKVYLLKI